MEAMNPADLIKALAGAVAGAVLAWTAHSFTIDGQVAALVSSVHRIEMRLDSIATQVNKGSK